MSFNSHCVFMCFSDLPHHKASHACQRLCAKDGGKRDLNPRPPYQLRVRRLVRARCHCATVPCSLRGNFGA